MGASWLPLIAHRLFVFYGICSIFIKHHEDTLARSKKYSSNLDISCSLILIFEMNSKIFCTRGEKY